MVRLILISLIILLILTLIISYNKTKEGFETLTSELEKATNNIISDIGSNMPNMIVNKENTEVVSNQVQQEDVESLPKENKKQENF